MFLKAKVKRQKAKTLLIVLSALVFSCTTQTQLSQTNTNVKETAPQIIADSFAYPISKNEYVTEAKDKKDEWYNALNFGENNHLGEDWNKNSGGNTDCGEPVYAAANGKIVYAENAGIGWGNVVIIEHTLADGKKVQTLYGHLLEISKTSGEVKKREQIGKVGNADGKYLCHLHFEMRLENCPMWNRAGGGYDSNRTGWTDPSEFIDKHRNNKNSL
jgi:murein DD-endopeptidase MepM/ murein hydrolase activator NlpD